MMYKTLDISIDDRGIAYVTLNIPEKRNALSAVMIEELTHFALNTGTATQTRAIVLKGAGDVFCAGGDLNWMKAQINADRQTRIREAQKLARMLQVLNEMPTPLVGALHGGVFGGGVGIACICDVVVALENTKFALSETKLGLIPATISPYVIARMGEGNARRVFMSGRTFDASEAKELGVVRQVVEAHDLERAIEFEVKPYLSTAPHAIGEAKALARALGPQIDQDIIDQTIIRLVDIWEGEEAAHGIASFLNKTPAKWTKQSTPKLS